MSTKIDKISIIVSTYNSPEYLSATLDALDQQNSDDFEVVVVDEAPLNLLYR